MNARNGRTHDKRGRVSAYGFACGITETYSIGAFSGCLERLAGTAVYRVTENADPWRIAYSGQSLKRARQVFDRSMRNAGKLNPELFAIAARLHSQGFFISPRDPGRNRAHAGEWMVCEDLTEGPTDDASRGTFCVVGDDLAELIREAGECY